MFVIKREKEQYAQNIKKKIGESLTSTLAVIRQSWIHEEVDV